MSTGAVQEWLGQLASQPSPFWALIFGTPTAGKSTQAQLMARRYGVTACSLDQLLQARHLPDPQIWSDEHQQNEWVFNDLK